MDKGFLFDGNSTTTISRLSNDLSIALFKSFFEKRCQTFELDGGLKQTFDCSKMKDFATSLGLNYCKLNIWGFWIVVFFLLFSDVL